MHHCVLVLLPKSVGTNRDTIAKVVRAKLAPFDENNEEQYTFEDMEEVWRKEYETKTCTRVKTPDGKLLWPWDDRFRVPGTIGLCGDTHKTPPNCEEVKVPFSEIYPTFADFMKDYHSISAPDPETGKYGERSNQKGKWDWWQIGGRWTGCLVPEYDPQKDKRNEEQCFLCHGTGTRPDGAQFGETWLKQTNGCNGCNGTGISKKWPTNWVDFAGDIIPTTAIPKDFVAFGIVEPDGKWHDKEDGLDWAEYDYKDHKAFDAKREKLAAGWEERFRALIDKHKENTLTVVVDMHT